MRSQNPYVFDLFWVTLLGLFLFGVLAYATGCGPDQYLDRESYDSGVDSGSCPEGCLQDQLCVHAAEGYNVCATMCDGGPSCRTSCCTQVSGEQVSVCAPVSYCSNAD